MANYSYRLCICASLNNGLLIFHFFFMKDFTAQGKNEKKNMIDQGLLLIERTLNPVIN